MWMLGMADLSKWTYWYNTEKHTGQIGRGFFFFFKRGALSYTWSQILDFPCLWRVKVVIVSHHSCQDEVLNITPLL